MTDFLNFSFESLRTELFLVTFTLFLLVYGLLKPRFDHVAKLSLFGLGIAFLSLWITIGDGDSADYFGPIHVFRSLPESITCIYIPGDMNYSDESSLDYFGWIEFCYLDFVFFFNQLLGLFVPMATNFDLFYPFGFFEAKLMDTQLIFNDCILVDAVGQYLKSLIILSSSCVILYSFQYSKTEKWHQYESLILILLSTASMMIMVSAFDFMTLYLTIELQSLCFYVLAASLRHSEYSVESGLKYFILGALASGIFLFGVSLLYVSTGLLNFGDLYTYYLLEGQGFHPKELTGPLQFGLFCIFVALLFKLTAAPFHLWAPDVYASAPTIVTAFFSLAPKIAFLAVFLRIGTWTFLINSTGLCNLVLVQCAALSMFLGAFGALGQRQIKRLLAFSSINHVGFLLLALVVGTQDGLEALFFYIFIYVVMTIGVFGVVLSLRGNRIGVANVLHISDLSRLSKSNPALAGVFTLILFSLAGIPPMAGFLSKFYVILSALGSSYLIYAALALLSSCVGCFYYLQLIKIMHFDQPILWHKFPQIDRLTSSLISLCCFLLVFVFVCPTVFTLYSEWLTLSLYLSDSQTSWPETPDILY